MYLSPTPPSATSTGLMPRPLQRPQITVPASAQDQALSAADMKKNGLPTEGVWFWTQQPMLDTWKHQPSLFTVARDLKKHTEKIVKVYGLFASPAAFYECLRKIPEDARCYYELIPEGSPCRAHADVEWIGERDDGNPRMTLVLEKLRSELKRVYPHFTAEIHVLCGSRLLAGGDKFKHSYHIVVSNLIFKSNHDGQMSSLFSIFDRECQAGDSWHYRDETSGEWRCVVDLSIYTKNRCFRLPRCSKQGSVVPLVPISEDPGGNEFISAADCQDLSSADVRDLLPMIVTTVQEDGDTVWVGECDFESGSLGKRKRIPNAVHAQRVSKRERSSTGVVSQEQGPDDENDQLETEQGPDDENDQKETVLKGRSTELMRGTLTDLLRMCGDLNTKVTCCSGVQDDHVLRFQCSNHGARPCLCSAGVTHKRNTCLLHLTPKRQECDDSGLADSYRVDYTCMSKAKHASLGAGSRNVRIGQLDKCSAANRYIASVYPEFIAQRSAARNDVEGIVDSAGESDVDRRCADDSGELDSGEFLTVSGMVLDPQPRRRVDGSVDLGDASVCQVDGRVDLGDASSHRVDGRVIFGSASCPSSPPCSPEQGAGMIQQIDSEYRADDHGLCAEIENITLQEAENDAWSGMQNSTLQAAESDAWSGLQTEEDDAGETAASNLYNANAVESSPITAGEPQIDLWARCMREILLTGGFDLATPEADLIFSSLKSALRQTPGLSQDFPALLLEWCTRSESYSTVATPDQAQDLWARASADIPEPIQTLYKIRQAHPAVKVRPCSTHFHGSSQNSEEIAESAEEDIDNEATEAEEADMQSRGGILRTLRSMDTDSMKPHCLIRVMKQVDEASCEAVLQFVRDNYNMDEAEARRVWNIEGSYDSKVLIDYLRMVLSPSKLQTESIPLLMGAPLLDFKKRQDNAVEFFLDDPSSSGKHVLYLDSGLVDGKASQNLRAFSNIQGSHADQSLAFFLLEVGISDKLLYDQQDAIYRVYDRVNGQWKKPGPEGCKSVALNVVMSEIKKWASFAIDIQAFCERGQRKPSDFLTNLRKLRAKYGEGRRAAEDVLQLLRPSISRKLDPPKHLLCFSNGVVDLRTGEFLGPAKPQDMINCSVPHAFDPGADVSGIAKIMLSFFPEACYGKDSQPIVDFLQVWQGYRLTGETNVQKALWMTGRGSNGKSVLSKLNAYAFGDEIHHSLSMEAFQKDGTGNNDDLFSAMHARCVDVMENTDNRKINEKLFKELTGEDQVQVAKKYVTGRKFEPTLKITFFNNDCPLWASQGAFAIHRRCWNLPMRAQFLDPGADEEEREKILEIGENACIFNKDSNLKNYLREQVQAYLLWCVQGAGKYYQADRNITAPEFILKATKSQQKDVKQLFEEFVVEFVECSSQPHGPFKQNDISLSSEEILHVFSEKENIRDMDEKTRDSLHQTLKRILTASPHLFQNVEQKTLKKYPTRNGPKDKQGYVHVKWKAGEITDCVCRVRSSYQNGASKPSSSLSSAEGTPGERI